MSSCVQAVSYEADAGHGYGAKVVQNGKNEKMCQWINGNLEKNERET